MEKKQLIKTVKSAQKHDEAAMRALYNEYAKPIYHLARGLMRNKEDAEDVMQETFIAAFAKLNKLKEPMTFQSWLGRIAANKCTDMLRKRREVVDADIWDIDESVITEDDSLLLPESALDSKETASMITDIIDSLPAAQKMCVYYHYYQDIPVRQIAEIVGANEHTVRSRLNLAKKKIREEVELLNSTQGVKLYSASPSVLTALLESTAAEIPAEAMHTAWQGVAAASTALIPVAGASVKLAATLICTVAVITGAAIGIAALGGYFGDDDDSSGEIFPEPDVIEASIDVPGDLGFQYEPLAPPDTDLAPGNTSMNIINFGRVAYSDGWVYFSNYNDHNTLWRMREDGTQAERVNAQESYDISVVGDWVYFRDSRGFAARRTAGTTARHIIDGVGVFTPIVTGGFVYYMTVWQGNEANFAIFRQRLDGTGGRQLIAGDIAVPSSIFDMHVGDGWVYYTDNNVLKRIRDDGPPDAAEIIRADVRYFIVHGERIYFTAGEDSGMYGMNPDGSDEQKLYDWASPVNAAGDWIYFFEGERYWMGSGNLYRIRTDGTEATMLLTQGFQDTVQISRVNIVNDYVYYVQGDSVLMRMNLDGTERQPAYQPNPEFILPDFEAFTEVDFGNTRSNLLNRGNLLLIDERVYFSEGGFVYSMNTDGGDRIIIADLREDDEPDAFWGVAQNLTVFGDEIALHIGNRAYHVAIDGSGSFGRMPSGVSLPFNEIGRWQYFINFSDNMRLYRRHIERETVQKIGTDFVTTFIISGDFIYYTNADDGNSLYRIRNDGMYRQKLNDVYTHEFNIVGEWIYFTAGNGVHRVNIYGEEYRQLVSGALVGDRGSLNIAGNLVFFNEHYTYYSPRLFALDWEGDVFLGDIQLFSDSNWSDRVVSMPMLEYREERFNLGENGENLLIARFDLFDPWEQYEYHNFATPNEHGIHEVFRYIGEEAEWSVIRNLEYRSGNTMYDPDSGREVIFDFDEITYTFGS
jgi:RNA polymerase sigma-70 factor (ECF subfamily)